MESIRLLDINFSLYTTVRKRIKQADFVDFFNFKKNLISAKNIKYVARGPSRFEDIALGKELLEILKETSDMNTQFIHFLNIGFPIKILAALQNRTLQNILIFHILTLPRNHLETLIYNKLLKIGNNKILLAYSSSVLLQSYLNDPHNYERFFVLPPAINIDMFKKRGSPLKDLSFLDKYVLYKKKKEINSADLYLLYIGPLTYERFPFRIILKTLRLLKKDYKINPHINIISRGDEFSVMLKELINYAKKEDVDRNITIYSKQLSEHEKAHIFSIHDVFLYLPKYHASDIPYVVPPLSPLEAMSSEMSLITTKIAGLENVIVNDYNGYIVNMDRMTKIIDILLKLSEKPIRNKISRNARKTIQETFSYKNVAGVLFNIYRNYL